MTHPNKLVKVSDIGALVEEIGTIIEQDEVGRLELPRKQQDVGRKRLSGALGLPKVEATEGRLKLYWHGHDLQGYEATLVGLYSDKSCAVVTDVAPNPVGFLRDRRDSGTAADPYKVWKAKNGPWF